MSKNVFVFGLSGRMGQEVKNRLEKDKIFSFQGGHSRSQPNLEPKESPHLVIDFSLPEGFTELCQFVEKQKVPLVCGTTGLSKDQKKKLKELGQKVPVFWASNMSFGVYLMCQLTEWLASYDKFYEYHVEETHHVHKKDKPSGTALTIEDSARKSTQNLKQTIAHREGEIFGIHSFFANSRDEVIEIKHEAKNRGLFAQGAIDVGKWLVSQPPGYYGMDDFFKTIRS